MPRQSSFNPCCVRTWAQGQGRRTSQSNGFGSVKSTFWHHGPKMVGRFLFAGKRVASLSVRSPNYLVKGGPMPTWRGSCARNALPNFEFSLIWREERIRYLSEVHTSRQSRSVRRLSVGQHRQPVIRCASASSCLFLFAHLWTPPEVHTSW